MKKFGLIAWIFCLGLFLIPKQNIYAFTPETKNCCSSSPDSKADSECCQSKEHHHSDDKDSKESCTDNCCHHCATCHSIPAPVFSKQISEYILLPFENYSSDHNFDYSTPHFSNHLDEIWQPPKI